MDNNHFLTGGVGKSSNAHNNSMISSMEEESEMHHQIEMMNKIGVYPIKKKSRAAMNRDLSLDNLTPDQDKRKDDVLSKVTKDDKSSITRQFNKKPSNIDDIIMSPITN